MPPMEGVGGGWIGAGGVYDRPAPRGCDGPETLPARECCVGGGGGVLWPYCGPPGGAKLIDPRGVCDGC